MYYKISASRKVSAWCATAPDYEGVVVMSDYEIIMVILTILTLILVRDKK